MKTNRSPCPCGQERELDEDRWKRCWRRSARNTSTRHADPLIAEQVAGQFLALPSRGKSSLSARAPCRERRKAAHPAGLAGHALPRPLGTPIRMAMDPNMQVDLELGATPAKTRVVVAMSGGVDSSVVAAMLARAGYDVVGVTLQLYDHGAATRKKGACCAGQDIHDARAVAARLGIPH